MTTDPFDDPAMAPRAARLSRRSHLRDRFDASGLSGPSSAPENRLRRLPAPTSPAAAVRWHRRSVESFGLTHRVTIPWRIDDVAPQTAVALTDVLTAWWTRRPGALAPMTTITSVTADVISATRGHRLVLTLTTSSVVEASDVASPLMDRDLRRALRTIEHALEPSPSATSFSLVPRS